ncbi:MAG: hypothetical protein WC769_05785 [Thermodesulfovibrionales bacterium]
MKRMLFVMMAAVICLTGYQTAWSFESGSTGALGALNPTASTEVTLPEDGILNYTTVNIPTGVTVTFKKNTANTPVYMLATSDVQIAGTVDVIGLAGGTLYNGVGGPGGFDGRNGGSAGQNISPGGKGMGPGGGSGGSVSTNFNYSASGGGGGGGFGENGSKGGGQVNFSPPASGGSSYGNTKVLPMIGGSGGGGGAGGQYSPTYNTGGFGGGGGGAILIASSTSINITGTIEANGGNGGKSSSSGNYAGCGGGGSGGAIRLMANKISGSGTVTVSGGAGGSNTWGFAGGAGGAGRIRFETTDLTGWTGTINPMTVYSYASPGTVFVSNLPTLTITFVNGVNVPATPSGKFGLPDITLPSSATNPVTVIVNGANIPVNSQVTLTSVPEYGASTNAAGTLSGTDASSTTSISITLSTLYQCILVAQATFTIQQAMYWDDEKIEKVRVAATMGKESEIVYITESGKEIKAELLAKAITDSKF